MMKLFDIVEVIKDIPEKGLRAGMRGAIVEIFTNPTLAYEVEFDPKSNDDLNTIALSPEQIRRVG